MIVFSFPFSFPSAVAVTLLFLSIFIFVFSPFLISYNFHPVKGGSNKDKKDEADFKKGIFLKLPSWLLKEK